MLIRAIAKWLAPAVAALVLLAAGPGPSAQAATVTIRYQCYVTMLNVIYMNWDVTVTAPATLTAGSTATIHTALTTPDSHPGAVPAGTYYGNLTLTLGGAGSGTVVTTGLANPALAAGEQLRIVGGTGQVTLNTRGTVTLMPRAFRINFTFNPWTFYDCTNAAAPSVTSIQVQ
jgi:hypothetical protein